MAAISVGILGCGFVGGALKQWLEEHNPEIGVLISDPAKGYNDDLSGADVIFLSIHLVTDDDGSQNIAILKDIIDTLPDKPIFIRTTILPGSSEKLSKACGKKVYFMPEFLTERTAYQDFCTQPMIFTGEFELLEKIFVGKKHVRMSSTEAEIAKYAHNVFGALKVSYFNCVAEMCRNMGAVYDNVKEGVLLSGYISPEHTKVPGPDGKFGYGGKCFPKDVDAFTEFAKGLMLHELLKEVKPINEKFRNESNDS